MEADQNILKKETRFKPYAYLLERYGISYEEQGAWLVHGKPNHDNQWIVCLSISLKNANEILDRVLRYLAKYGYPFVLIKDQLQHNRINNNAFPIVFFGKALMIFTKDITFCDMLANDLARMTNNFEGLHIPNCIRLGSIVYVAFSKLNPDYKGEKDNAPFILEDVPDVDKLFPESLKWREKEISRVIKRRYLPISLIRSSYKGNILKGLDLYKMRWVFIKQARPWATEDIHGRQMRDRLLWQMKVSKDLTEKVNLPKILDYVEQEGYCYLITEYIQGILLDVLPKEESNSLEDILPSYLLAVEEVQKMHEAGYIHRDLTSKNIVTNKKDNKVYLTDFELSHPLEKTEMIPYDSGTIGYMSPQQISNQIPTKSDDVFSLGALLYYLVGSEYPNQLVSLSEKEREENIDGLRASDKIKSIIKGCISPDPNNRWDMNRLNSAVRNIVKPEISNPNQKVKAIKFRQIRKKLAASGTLIILAFLTVFTLWKLSDEPNDKDNGFTRNYLHTTFKPVYALPLPKYTTDFIGLDSDTAYFSTSIPGQIAQLHVSNGFIENKVLIQDTRSAAKFRKGWTVQADSLGYAIFDGFGKTIILFSKNRIPVSYHSTTEPFTRAVRFSSTSVAMRKFKPGLGDQLMYRYDLIDDNANNESQVTEIFKDAGLVTGGYLDCEGGKGCIYVTRYANHIYLLDTSMNIVKTGSTIDTFNHYTIKSSILKNGNSSIVTNGGPVRYINKGISTNEGKLFVYSDVRADNETKYQFIDGNVIDVYSMSDLKYIGSYRFATFNKERIRRFKIRGGMLYMYFPDRLEIYNLSVVDKGLKVASL